jgi:hypothetical protein
MSEMEGGTFELSRMFAFANSLRDTGISLESPGCGRFKASMHHTYDLHDLKQIGNRVQLRPPIWTLEQVNWTK